MVNINLLVKNSNKIIYIKIKDNAYRLKYKENLVDKYYEFDKKVLDNNLKNFNSSFSSIDKPIYVYFISTAKTKDLTNNSDDLYYNYIKENIKGITNISMFSIKDYNEYKKYFYKTDHHWNPEGQYRGYKDIMKLLGINNTIEPKEKDYNIKFYGSYARMAIDKSIYDDFVTYEYNIPNYVTYINGKEKVYDNKEKYDNGKYSKELWKNRYAEYYGTDYAEVIYDFDNKNKDNLLIIGNSYSNSINPLIAMNFNKTFVIDMRHKENFILSQYVKDNNIDKVLFMGDYLLFVDAPLFGGVQ